MQPLFAPTGAHGAHRAERANSALAASSASLLVAVVGVALFLPPLATATLSSVLRITGTGVMLATALLLHWVFLAIAAKRMQRSRFGWVSLSVLLFPVGSAASLILLNWFSEEHSDSPALAPAPHRP